MATQNPQGGFLALVKYLRQEAGYTGSLKLADVKKFIADNDLTIEIDGAKSIDELHKKTVTIKADAGEEVVIEEAEPAIDAEMADEDEEPMPKKAPAPRRKAVAAMVKSTGRSDFRRDTARKMYERKAAAGRASFSDVETAEAYGAWMRSTVLGSKWYPQKDADLEILSKTHLTTVNTAGGAFVPDDFKPELITLLEDFGVARQVIGVTTMARDTLTMPRIDSVFATTWTGEAVALTEDTLDTSNIELVARKLTGFGRVSSELLNDSAVNVADTLAQEMARGLANKEDLAALLGDGTSTYGGVVGFANAIGSAGVVTASGNLFSEFTDADIQAALGKLPGRVHARGTISIVCHSAAFFNVFNRLAFAKGGITYAEGQNGRPQYRYNGYPVVFAQVLPGTDANSQKAIYIGDFGTAAKFGEVGSVEIAQSTERYFDTDEVAYRAVERVAINVHDAGDANAAGDVVVIQSAGS